VLTNSDLLSLEFNPLFSFVLWFCSDAVLTKETCQLLREPTFDNWQWEDEEMLVLLQQMYLELELPKKFDIEINILRNFIVKLYHHYNHVPFHNFRHCFCVTQMVSYIFLHKFYDSSGCDV